MKLYFFMRTPIFSSLEALALIAAGLVMFGSAQVQAGSSNKNGNPYGNGTFFNNSGTYTAIMRGQNLMGVTQFNIFADGLYPSSGWNMLNGASSNNVQPGQTNPGSGTPGFVSLYYNGSSYNGPAFSVVDPGGSQIGSVFYTYKAGGAQWDPGQTNLGVSVTNIVITNSVTITNVSTDTNGVVTTTVEVTNSLISTNIVRTNTLSAYGLNGGYNYYDGYWNASLQNKYPNQVFYGNGAVSLGQSGNPTYPSPINQANGQAGVTQIPFSVQGTRVSGSASQIY